jgi:hypothetical protein
MKKPDDFNFLDAVSPSVQWLRESIDINQGKGSSAYFSRLRHPVKGWSPAYPETTGYLIPTLLQYSKISGFEDLKAYAEHCVNWLLEIQDPKGWFPALYADSHQPSVFNSGMILFGLLACFKENPDASLKQAIQNTVSWIMDQLDEDFRFLEKNQTAPTYYTRVLWALAEVQSVFPNPDWQIKIETSLQAYNQLIQKNGWIQNWEFPGQEFAFTHTMAYTWRGFLETSILTNDQKTLDKTLDSFKIFLVKIRPRSWQTGGFYQKNWDGEFRFNCLTGLFQLCLLCNKAYEITGQKIFRDHQFAFFDEGFKNKNTSLIGKKGGVFGSEPIFGKYMPWKQPNWAVKFYLDACLLYC